jgi:hypothetical protein
MLRKNEFLPNGVKAKSRTDRDKDGMRTERSRGCIFRNQRKSLLVWLGPATTDFPIPATLSQTTEHVPLPSRAGLPKQPPVQQAPGSPRSQYPPTGLQHCPLPNSVPHEPEQHSLPKVHGLFEKLLILHTGCATTHCVKVATTLTVYEMSDSALYL